MNIEDVKDHDSLEAWILALPKYKQKPVSVVIAHRCALRVLPFAIQKKKLGGARFASYFESVMRTIVVSRVAAILLNREIEIAATVASAATTLKLNSVYKADDAAAARSAAYATFAASVEDIHAARYAADSAEDAEIASSDAAAIWLSIRSDLAYLDRGLGGEIVQFIPLWAMTPDWWFAAKLAMREFLNSPKLSQEGFEFWVDWYDNVSSGYLPFPSTGKNGVELEHRIALGDGRKDFWNRAPATINAEIARWVREDYISPLANIAAEDLDLVQRPAGHVFEIENDRIVAKPVYGGDVDLGLAADVRKELADKARNAATSLQDSQCPSKISDQFIRLAEFLDAVIAERPALGTLLMRSETVENAIHTLLLAEFRKYYQEDVISQIQDVFGSLETYKSLFPQILKIEAQRVALRLAQGDAAMVNVQLDAIALVAARSEIVSHSALTALTENKSELDELNAIISTSTSLGEVGEANAARASLVGGNLMVATNFVKSNLIVLGTRTAKSMGKGYDSAVLELTDKGIKLAAVALLGAIAGPLAAIAAAVPLLSPFAKRAAEVKKDDDLTEV